MIANWKINDNIWYNTKGDVDCLYLIRDKGGTGLISIGNCVTGQKTP